MVNALKKLHLRYENIKLFIWFTHIVQSMWNHMHEINITNFIKVKNHFNCFWTIFTFFSTQLQICFS